MSSDRDLPSAKLTKVLPAEVLASILTGWLDWVSVAKLDCALCSIAERKEYLNVMKELVTCSIKIDVEDVHNLGKWMMLRMVRAKEISYNSNSTVKQDIIAELVLLSSQTLRKFNWYGKDLHTSSLVFNSLSNHCAQLSTLVFSRCCLDDSVWRIIAANKGITGLQMWKCEYSPTLFAGPAMSTSLSGTNIIKLSIYQGRFVADEPFVRMFHYMPQLRSLEASAFTNKMLVQVSKLCPKIVHLFLFGEFGFPILNDETFVTVVTNLHSLQSIRIDFASRITERALAALATQHGNSLLYLDLHLADNPFLIGGVVALIKDCRNLLTLVFSDFFGREEVSSVLAEIVDSSVLHLHLYSRMKKDAFTTIAKNFPRLITFGYWIKYLSEGEFEGIEHLRMHCKSLKTIYFPRQRDSETAREFCLAESCSVLDVFTFPV